MTTSDNNSESGTQFLEAAYKDLEFDQGALLPALESVDTGVSPDWLDRGDWQLLAAQVGADKLFFVDRDPVVVFARSEADEPEVLRKIYQRIWCMARPEILFLASPGRLDVFDLTKPPPTAAEELDDKNRLMERVTRIAEVQSKLAAYHRERLETGAVFGEDRFRDALNRADRALIRDLKTVRQQLSQVPVAQGMRRPTLGHLHSLIGRAIFVRYLEDREILIPSYFEKVAEGHPEWIKLLGQAPSAPALEPRMAELRFLRILQDKDFTYALFDQLAHDFNGDTFPVEESECERIQQTHLDRLRNFLLGTTSSQQMLFFFAYRFDVIPIELISAIYEEFYIERTGDQNQASHYTPPALVEFVLANTLTSDVLAQRPRVLDPACGSGIFLVESFRRMVRYLWAEQNGKRLSRLQLREIMRDQIAGIDINEEAIRVAAFSLYLAFLHYQKPREINNEQRLPHLKWVSVEERLRREKERPGAEFFDVLLHGNSFEAALNKEATGIYQRFGPGTATAVVGNPPWGYPKTDDREGRRALAKALEWCEARKDRTIGDQELSQAFILLSLELLKDGGRAGLLVSSGVLFKHHENSRDFRRVWLRSARLEKVVNFAHVRHIFFSDPEREAQGISPFLSVVFEKVPGVPPLENRLEYWSAKRTAIIENTQCVLLNRGDMHWLSQRDCLADERLWKIYWWGGHRDEMLIREMERFPKLKDLNKAMPGVKVRFGQGFKVANKSVPASWLKEYQELPAGCLRRYNRFDRKALRNIPERVERRGVEDVYHGHRLLVGRGIKAGGYLISRFETHKYAFRNSVHGIKLDRFESWQEDTITGIFWSSLARYFYFVTSGSWGFWHDEIHLEDVGQMPIRFPEHTVLRKQISQIVADLRQSEEPPEEFQLVGSSAESRVQELEQELDDAIFDLYGLSEAQRDLVRDMCSTGLNLFYEYYKGDALRETSQPSKRFGTVSDLTDGSDGLQTYLRVFVQEWNNLLHPDGELLWRVLSPSSVAPLLAVCFRSRYRKEPLPEDMDDGPEAWRELLERLARDSRTHAGSTRIFIDTFFQDVSDREIILIKRNERRFWTRTAAREDAESAMTRLTNLETHVAEGKQ